jgi:hypothetical protein
MMFSTSSLSFFCFLLYSTLQSFITSVSILYESDGRRMNRASVSTKEKHSWKTNSGCTTSYNRNFSRIFFFHCYLFFINSEYFYFMILTKIKIRDICSFAKLSYFLFLIFVSYSFIHFPFSDA